MTVYAFTCILAGEKKRASQVLRDWKGEKNNRNRALRFGLRCAGLMPAAVNRWVYNIRLKVF
jgi:hypothetical protein